MRLARLLLSLAAASLADSDALGGPGAGSAIDPAGRPAVGADGSTPADEPTYAVPTTPDHVGRILARVMVNGQGPFRFMVDTGANQTVLSRSLALRLTLPVDEAARVAVSGIAGTTVTPTAYVERLESGPLHLHALHLPVLAGPVLDDIDGILGVDSLAYRTLTADFARDRLAISGGFGGVPLGDVVLPARLLSRHLLEVDGLLGGARVKAIIDTGSPRTLGNPALLRALARRFQLGAHSVPTRVIDATEALQSGRLEQVPPLQFGTTVIGNLYITFGDFSVFDRWSLQQQPALLVGMDVLGLFAELSIDYRRRELGLRTRADAVLRR